MRGFFCSRVPPLHENSAMAEHRAAERDVREPRQNAPMPSRASTNLSHRCALSGPGASRTGGADRRRTWPTAAAGKTPDEAPSALPAGRSRRTDDARRCALQDVDSACGVASIAYEPEAPAKATTVPAPACVFWFLCFCVASSTPSPRLEKRHHVGYARRNVTDSFLVLKLIDDVRRRAGPSRTRRAAPDSADERGHVAARERYRASVF